MMRMRWTALVAVVAAGARLAIADVPRDLEDYVVFGEVSTHLKNDALITSGHVGANQAASGRVGRSGLSLGRNNSFADGTAAVGDQCVIGRGTRVFDLYTNNLLSRPDQFVLGGTGPIAFSPLPVVTTLPPLPAFAPGTQAIVVPKNGTTTLPPGAYGRVIVPNGSTLELPGGHYEFREIRTGKAAKVLVGAPSTINIELGLRLSDRSTFGPSTSGVGARQVKVNVGGRFVRLGANADVAMDLLATNATIRVGRSFHGRGRFIGLRVGSDHSPTFEHPQCGDGVQDPGEECDDGNAAGCDGCSPTCRLERCGDGTTCAAQGEDCDDGNLAGCDGCSAGCRTERCGDGATCASQGEQCDDGNTSPCDGCSAGCRTERCGDGTTCASQGEQCDDGNVTACDGCSATCHTERCGDGVVCAGQGEQCDPPASQGGSPDCGPTCRNISGCGDGQTGPGEECDDGNAVGCDGCTACHVDRCGDGTQCAAAGEDCDDGNTTACDGCSATCHTERCGDGDGCASQGEQCDDGNVTACDGCSATCTTEGCGDGQTCAPQDCDDGNTDPCDGCSATCQAERCGDGVVCWGQDELCDDGNNVGCDGCSATCQLERCGDGVVCASEGEECDPPSASQTCPLCSSTCQLGPSCGDGAVDAACGEECDDGNAVACDGCTGCLTDRCGDGRQCANQGEECDDANTTACDGCSPTCTLDRCGDGTTCANQNEQCDDGNTTACDGCSATCHTERCGDATVCPPEECDDGNTTQCDGCSPACLLDRCGDGTLCMNQGEQCDPPGGQGMCSVCTATCQLGGTCGNGTVDAACGEECDDGNTTGCDGCTGCRVDRCGDGTLCVNAEQCDDGNTDPCDGCSPTCRTDRCGDGVTCPSEECDDGNTTRCDGCSATCTTEFCGDGVLCTIQGETCDPPNGTTCDDLCSSLLPFFCTFTQEEYGDPGGAANDPVTGLVSLNPSVLPVTVGAPGDVSLTVDNQTALVCFLPTQGVPDGLCDGGLPGCGGDMLIDTCTNPPILDPLGGFTSSGGQGTGTLGGEAIALKLNLALSDMGVTKPGLRDLVLPNLQCAGICVMENSVPTYYPISCDLADGVRTVADLVTLADQALRDPGSFEDSDPISLQELNEAISSVNDAFEGCRPPCSASGAFLDDLEEALGLF